MSKQIINNDFHIKDAIKLSIQLLATYVALTLILGSFFDCFGINMLENLSMVGLILILCPSVFLILHYDKFGSNVIHQLKQIPRDFTILTWLLVIAIADSILISQIFYGIEKVWPALLTEGVIDQVVLGSTLFLRLIFLALVPALSEEVIFRGIFTKKLAQHYGNIKGIIISAIIFGVFHLSPIQFLSAFLGGLLFGFVYIRTQNIYYPICLHLFCNAIILLWDEFYLDFNLTIHPIWFTIIGMSLLAIGLWKVWVKTIPLKNASSL